MGTGSIWINNNPFNYVVNNPNFGTTYLFYRRVKFTYDDNSHTCVLRKKVVNTTDKRVGYSYYILGDGTHSITQRQNCSGYIYMQRIFNNVNQKPPFSGGLMDTTPTQLNSRNDAQPVLFDGGGSQSSSGDFGLFNTVLTNGYYNQGYIPSFETNYGYNSCVPTRTSFLSQSDSVRNIPKPSIADAWNNYMCFGALIDHKSDLNGWSSYRANYDGRLTLGSTTYRFGNPDDYYKWLYSSYYNHYSATDYYDTSVGTYMSRMFDFRFNQSANLDRTKDEDLNEWVWDGAPMIRGLPIFYDEQTAIHYAQTGEGEPDEYLPDGDPEPDPEPQPEPDVSDGGDDDDMESEEGTEHDRDCDNVNVKGQNFYRLTKNDMDSFITWFWRDLFTTLSQDIGTVTSPEAFAGAYGKLSDYIISCRKYHIPGRFYGIEPGSPEPIVLGRYTAPTTANRLEGVRKEQHVGDFFVKPKYANFFGYAPYTSVSLYLPFVGIVPLDANMVINRCMTVFASCDLYTGQIMYDVYTRPNSQSGAYTYLYTTTGKCAVDIPLALADSTGDATRFAQTISNGLISTAIGGLVGGGVGALSGVVNMSTNLTSGNLIAPPNPQQVNGGGNQSYLQPATCAIIEQSTNYKEWGDRQKYANAGLGYVCHEVHKLDDLPQNGNIWVQTADPHTVKMTGATDTEIEEVRELLQGGVWV